MCSSRNMAFYSTLVSPQLIVKDVFVAFFWSVHHMLRAKETKDAVVEKSRKTTNRPLFTSSRGKWQIHSGKNEDVARRNGFRNTSITKNVKASPKYTLSKRNHTFPNIASEFCNFRGYQETAKERSRNTVIPKCELFPSSWSTFLYFWEDRKTLSKLLALSFK